MLASAGNTQQSKYPKEKQPTSTFGKTTLRLLENWRMSTGSGSQGG